MFPLPLPKLNDTTNNNVYVHRRNAMMNEQERRAQLDIVVSIIGEALEIISDTTSLSGNAAAQQQSSSSQSSSPSDRNPDRQ